MSNIRFISKQENYVSKDENKGIFKNPYGVPFAHSTNLETKTTVINFKFCYQTLEGKEILLSNSELLFTDTNTDTIVNIGTVEAPVEKELIQAITDGWTYNKEKVITWGYPDYLRALGYYRIVNGVYAFHDNPVFAQIAKDWTMLHAKFEGIPCGEHFELEEIETP